MPRFDAAAGRSGSRLIHEMGLPGASGWILRSHRSVTVSTGVRLSTPEGRQ